VGPKVSVPEEYRGFFEILSEDGRSARAMESVAELARRFPDSVLIREPIPSGVFVSKSDDVDAVVRARMTTPVAAGETLILVGEAQTKTIKGLSTKFLRCFNSRGENVFLPFDLSGPLRFSAVAKEANISGVHTAANLLKNKRPPFMAR